jgi:acyl-coenzyme A thioesterase PaaI-like protein
LSTLQPNSRHCFVCGLENPFGLHLRFHTTQPGEVTVEYTVPEQFQGYPGVVHGGITAAMLDEVIGRVYMGDPAAPRFMYTARLELRYRKNVPTGVPLRLVGRAIKDRGRSATASGTLYAPDGELLVEAEALLVDVPDGVLENTNLDTLGWKVYPE